MAQAKTLAELVRDKYDNAELQEAVIADVAAHGTEAAILDGCCTLPHPQDAARWHERKQKLDAAAAKEKATADKIKAQADEIAALKAKMTAKGGA